jgi:hypothetical protein
MSDCERRFANQDEHKAENDKRSNGSEQRIAELETRNRSLENLAIEQAERFVGLDRVLQRYRIEMRNYIKQKDNEANA